MDHLSSNLETYAETLQRLCSVAHQAEQVLASQVSLFRASLVHPPLRQTGNLSAAYAYHRQRKGL